MRKVRILNLYIDNLTTKQFLESISEGVVFTTNVDHLMKLQSDSEFYNAYKNANFVLCDSKLVQFASFFLGSPILEKVSGSDFFPEFYKYHKQNDDVRIFLLGAAEGVASKALDIINEKVKREIVVDALSPSYGFEDNENECEGIIKRINCSGASVLAVGVGAPKQEKWILKYKDRLPNIKIFIAIGATIDFEANNVKRAPAWISNLGMEWLYRLFLEPRRLYKRYLIDDPPFFYLVLKQKFGFYKNPMDYS